MIGTNLFSGHGFGINTNILDTNVLNLAVVLAIVISVLGDAVRDLLSNRRRTIMANLTAADDKAQEIVDRLDAARRQLDEARQAALEIRREALDAAEREKANTIAQAEAEGQRLQTLCDDRLRFQLQKATERVSRRIIAGSVEDALKSLERRTKSRYAQIWVNTKKMTYYKTIQAYRRLMV
jgi:F-type H+-transporting ATPase subunit b